MASTALSTMPRTLIGRLPRFRLAAGSWRALSDASGSANGLSLLPRRSQSAVPVSADSTTEATDDTSTASTIPSGGTTAMGTTTTGGGGDTASDGDGTTSHSNLLQGIIVDHAVDLKSLRPGDRLDIPYELTVSETMQDFWHSAFYSQDRIHTSTPFCRKMGLQDRVLPFSLALFLTSSMTHADAAKVQVGFGKVWYLWPTFAGDTFRKSFTVNAIRNTSDGQNSIVHFTCDLLNHRGRLCMRADKRMLFAFSVPESHHNAASWLEGIQAPTNANMFRDHLLSKATTVLAEEPSHTLTKFQTGQCILHTMNRALTFSQCQQLASLARLTHPRHFDIKTYDRYSEILVPGGLVLGLALSASARDLHEILHEEIVSVNYLNSLSPEQIVGAISYIERVDNNNVPGDLELLTVRTLGIKNVNCQRELDGVGIPLELFQSATPKQIETICKQQIPLLKNKIVVQVERKILRQAYHEEVFLL